MIALVEGSSGDHVVRVVTIIALIVVFSTTIILESNKLQFANNRPRQLQTFTVPFHQLPSSNSSSSNNLSLFLLNATTTTTTTDLVAVPETTTTTTKTKSNFMEPIDCALPIPSSSTTRKKNKNVTATAIGNNNRCVRFFPERFFQTVEAAPFQQQYIHSKQVKTEHPVIHMTLQDTLLEEVTHNDDDDDDDRSRFPAAVTTFQQQQQQQQQQVLIEQYPHTLTYFHIRKCGGTTMFRSLSDKTIRIPYHVNKYNKMMIEELGLVRDIYNQQRIEQKILINNNNNKRGMEGNSKAVVFSFVRDPVIRFLSSVGQIVHMNKIKEFSYCREHHHHHPRGKIVKEEEESSSSSPSNATIIAKSQSLVRCILRSIKTTTTTTSSASVSDATSIQSDLQKQQQQQQQGNNNHAVLPPPMLFDYIDQHMLPQAYELRARSLEYDIAIHLMGMEQIAPTLRTLVGPKRENRHARSSRVGDYTKGYILDPATILTKDMIEDICHIYAVDVLLLTQTGIVDSTLCDIGDSSRTRTDGGGVMVTSES